MHILSDTMSYSKFEAYAKTIDTKFNFEKVNSENPNILYTLVDKKHKIAYNIIEPDFSNFNIDEETHNIIEGEYLYQTSIPDIKIPLPSYTCINRNTGVPNIIVVDILNTETFISDSYNVTDIHTFLKVLNEK